MNSSNTKKKSTHTKWISGQVGSGVILDLSQSKETIRLTKKAQKRSLFERIERLKSSLN